MTKFKEIPMEKLVSRQIRLWEMTYERPKVKTQKLTPPCITIAKEMGSGGVELAQNLANRLQWKLFDKNLVEYIARKAKVRNEMVKIFDEKTQNEIHNWVLTLLDHQALGSDKYYKHLVTVIRTIGEHGYGIILGRGGNFILPADSTLRLKIMAARKDRINHIMEARKITRNRAESILSDADKERMAFIQRFFHKDYDDPLFYDLVLNMSNLGLKMAEEIITRALRAKISKGLSKRESGVMATAG